jgi:hypothetical protein
MTARDELAKAVNAELATYKPITAHGFELSEEEWADRGLTVEHGSDMPHSMVDTVIAAGWRKMPIAAELTDCIISVDDQRDTDVLVAAILALMDGDNE